jgi:hypothetical protein
MMKLNDLLNLEIKGLREAVNMGVSEASLLGAELLGLTLDNGVGLVLRVTPDEKIRQLLVVSQTQLPREVFAVFVRPDGIKLLIYKIEEIKELGGLLGSGREVIYVEVIKGDLEDFLLEALDR